MTEVRALAEWSTAPDGTKVRDVQKVCRKCGYNQFHVEEEELKFRDGSESFGSTEVICVRCGEHNMSWS